MKSRSFGAVVLFLALLGVVLRCAATRGELWLDELWSLELLRGVTNPLDILVRVRHDNNHPLNSLWLWFLGEPRPAWAYRLPSLLFSVAALVVVTRRTMQTPEGWRALWVLLLATSFMMVLYGSEARGYSLAIACALIAYTLAERLPQKPDKKSALALGVVCAVGTLSHAIFVPFVVMLALWIAYLRMVRIGQGITGAIATAAAYFPLACAALVAGLFYGRVEVGGAAIVPFAQVAASSLMVMFGGPEVSSNALPLTVWWLGGSVFVLCCCLIELYLWNRSRDPMAVLVALNLAAPILAVALVKPSFILTRYFLLPVIFTYLLFARFLSRLAAQGVLGTVVSFAFLLVFLVGNAMNITPLVTNGRVHYREAFAFLLDSRSDIITVGGENDFQNQLRLEYFRPIFKDTTRIHYVPNFMQQSTPPHFVILESVDPFEPFPDKRTFGQHGEYTLQQSYSAPLFSGSRWLIYGRSKEVLPSS